MRVRVRRDELDTREPRLDHGVQRVAAPATHSDDLDRAGLIDIVAGTSELGENAVAFAWRRLAMRRRREIDQGRGVAAPFGGTADDLPVGVDVGDFKYRHLGQLASLRQPSPPASAELAIQFEFFQDRFQPCPVGAADSKGPGDFPFTDRRRALVDKFQDVLLRRTRRSAARARGHLGQSPSAGCALAEVRLRLAVAARFGFLRPPPFFFAFAASSTTACSSVTSSADISLGNVALTRPCLT